MQRVTSMSSVASEANAISRKKPFEATPTQEKFMNSTSQQAMLSGSFGAGKSRCGCEKGLLMNLKYPGNRGLIVRNTFTDVRASTIEQTLLEEVLPESHIASHNQTKHKIEHFTGTRDANGAPVLSEIHYHGLDEAGSGVDELPTKIGGQQYGWIFVDEAIEISRGAWVQLMGRLRYTGKEQAGKMYKVPFRQIYTATNPGPPTHWLYDWFIDDPREGTDVFFMTAHELAEHVESVPEDYVDMLEINFPGVYKDRYVHGEWVAAEGIVYNEFDPKTHVRSPSELPPSVDAESGGDSLEEWSVERRVKWSDDHTSVWVQPPSDWKVYRAIDFGHRNPFVCLWIARDVDRDLHVVFREFYKSEQLIQDIAPEIQKASQGLTIERSFADPSSPGDRETLQREGVTTKKADNDVSAGLQATKSKMGEEVGDYPRVIFMEDALIHPPDERLDEKNVPTRTVEEIPEYQWDEDKEEPIDEDDHGCDALRYYIYSIEARHSWSREEMEALEGMFNEQQSRGQSGPFGGGSAW